MKDYCSKAALVNSIRVLGLFPLLRLSCWTLLDGDFSCYNFLHGPRVGTLGCTRIVNGEFLGALFLKSLREIRILILRTSRCVLENDLTREENEENVSYVPFLWGWTTNLCVMLLSVYVFVFVVFTIKYCVDRLMKCWNSCIWYKCRFKKCASDHQFIFHAKRH